MKCPFLAHPPFTKAILLPSDEVRERPAGVGREEPNQDPRLGDHGRTRRGRCVGKPWENHGKRQGDIGKYREISGNIGKIQDPWSLIHSLT